VVPAPSVFGASARRAAGDARVAPSIVPLPPRHRTRLRLLAGATAVIFLVGLLAVTGLELLTGGPVLSSQRGSGTSVGRVLGYGSGSTSTTTDTAPTSTMSPATATASSSPTRSDRSDRAVNPSDSPWLKAPLSHRRLLHPASASPQPPQRMLCPDWAQATDQRSGGSRPHAGRAGFSRAICNTRARIGGWSSAGASVRVPGVEFRYASSGRVLLLVRSGYPVCASSGCEPRRSSEYQSREDN
jgi:hypothetical protein